MLNKIIIKSLLKSKFLLLAVFVLFTAAISLVVLTNTAYDNIEASFDQYKVSSNFEDFQFPIMKKLEDRYDSSWIEEFETDFNLYLEKKEENTVTDQGVSYGINRYNNQDRLNTIMLIDGELPNNKDEIIMTPEYLENHNYQIGDEFIINDYRYVISGTGYFPEYTFPVNMYDNSFSIGNDAFVPIFMNAESYDALDDSTEIIHFSGKFNNPEDANNDTYKEMMNYKTFEIAYKDAYGNVQIDKEGNPIAKEISQILVVIPENLNPGLSSIEEEINGEKHMFNVLGIIIIIITILVTVVLFNNIFDSQKREMGILKAEGISLKELSIGFSIGLFIILFLASITGYIGGYFLRGAIYNLLDTLFSLPITVIAQGVYLKALLNVIKIDILVIILVYIISIYRKLRIKPLVLIKNITSEKAPVFKMDFLTKKLSFKNKYKLNIAFRNIGTSLLLIFGLLASSFLLLMGSTMQSSVSNAIDSVYGDKYTYDYKITYSDGVLDPDFDQNSTISETGIEMSSITKTNGETKKVNNVLNPDEPVTVSFYAFDTRNNKFIHLYSDITGKQNSNLYEDGVAISSNLATRCGIEVGDEIAVTNPYSHDEIINFKVNDIVTDEISSNVYFDIYDYQKFFGLQSDYANGEVGAGDKKVDVMLYDSAATYKESKDLEANLQNLMALMMTFISFIMVIASLISFVTLTVIVMIVIKKSNKTISVMKVLGYTDSEITAMTTSVYKYIIFVAYFLAIPLFRGLIQFIVNFALAQTDISIRVKIPLNAIIVGLIIIYIIYFIAMKLAKRSINKITLAESLKVDE